MLMVTVAGPLPLEIMPFHGAGEAPALAGRRDIDLVPGRVDIHTQLLADGVRGDVVDPELHQSSPWVDPRPGIMAGQRLVDRTGPPGAVGDLERGITVRVIGLNLDNADRRHPDNRDRDGALALVPDLGHTDFFADNRSFWGLRGHSSSSYAARSARVTPGRSSFHVVPWRPRCQRHTGDHGRLLDGSASIASLTHCANRGCSSR